MNPFTKHTGLVAALDRIDVDTDQLIPKEFLKRIERTGFGQYLFNDWRFRENNELNPDFELNRPAFQGATILLARRNFGCGSSREHAVWALADYGFRALISVSFADIFYNNCFENGVLPVTLDEQTVERLFQRTNRMDGYRLTVDLEQCTVSDEEGLDVPFQIDGFRRECLLNGWDSIALTLQHSDEITRFEAARGDR